MKHPVTLIKKRKNALNDKNLPNKKRKTSPNRMKAMVHTSSTIVNTKKIMLHGKKTSLHGKKTSPHGKKKSTIHKQKAGAPAPFVKNIGDYTCIKSQSIIDITSAVKDLLIRS